MQNEAEALQLAGNSAQITFVKSRADAERIATRLGAACWHSKLDEAIKIQALHDFGQGKKKLVSTYGLGVGMNLKVRGLAYPPSPPSHPTMLILHRMQIRGHPVSTVDLLDMPWSASCAVQVCRVRGLGLGFSVTVAAGIFSHSAGRHRPNTGVGRHQPSPNWHSAANGTCCTTSGRYAALHA
jgi:hypothetical protein